VLLDLMMLGINGWEVLETLRGSRPNVPVVVLSAAQVAGCADYIQKPVSYARLSELLEVIRARVEGRSTGT
jgi:DNA-binding response OmpR family regulator